ncbi:cytidylyltransferase domain-containing protein [Neobacillus niacini]|uniref:acylneuraminate cytidylyltransferase family protein n=1 Tax=Neobacillus niacini TaxID=86668 RepID=UPI001C8D1648|nr:acylneuraminate cytidylyltransferase family protein [Neobacillus niacini]MBY0145908.1 acylneuraminate cytidylyltransferase family protein [Neobacillus niacini]
MYNQKSFLAVIPARGGSKGIPGKNIIEVYNKPLIQYTIDAALDSKYLDRIIVSTDSQSIAEVSLKCGAEIPFMRPETLSTDTSKTIDVLIHAIEELKKEGNEYNYLVLLQPTQPLRTGHNIDEAIEMIINNNEESLVSISEVSEHPLLMRELNEDGKLQNLLNMESTVRRQDFPKYYKVNGSIYINEININFNLNTSLNDNKLGYLMNKENDIDIDDFFDLELFKLKIDKMKVHT